MTYAYVTMGDILSDEAREASQHLDDQVQQLREHDLEAGSEVPVGPISSRVLAILEPGNRS